MTSAAWAAVIGAVVGGGIGFLAQLGVLAFNARRERRAAAQIIYGELATNTAEALGAVKVGEWPSSSGVPRRVAWDTYGVKLLGGRGVERVARIASAYSRLEDVAWLARNGVLSPSDLPL